VKANQSPGFYFSAFLLAMLGALTLAALIAPMVQTALEPIKVFPLHRIFTRLAELGLFLAVWWLLRRLRLLDRQLMGYGPPRRIFIGRMLLGFAFGLAVMSLTVLPLFGLDLRVLRPGHGSLGQLLIEHGPRALMTGFSVALVEETFFRGALQGAMSRSGRYGAALFVVPALYAAVHFLGDSLRIPADQVHAWSGFIVLRSFFTAYSEPLAILDAFMALYAVGLLLALVRRRFGDIAACIGLHAGFVAIITLLRAVSVHEDSGRWAWLVGPFDGLLGLWVFVTTAVACVAFLLWPRAGSANQNGLAMTK
jgi:CAAX protease family protein